MKIDAAAKAIVDFWDVAWTAANPTVVCVYDDEQFAQPNPPVAWVRFAIRHQAGSQMTQGRPARYRRAGNIFIQVFSPVDQGRKPLDVLVASAIGIIETVTIGALSDCVTTYASTPREAPTDGQIAQMTVVTPFDYWEQK